MPGETGCYEIANLLDLAGIPFILEEDYGRNSIKKTFPEDAQYPLLVIVSNIKEVQSADLSGADTIFRHMVRAKLVPDLERHTAKETQGVFFVE